MSYSNAVFYLDPESGSDAARSDLVPTAYANNGSGAVRVTCNSTAAYATGAVFDIAGTTGSVYVGAWKVTIIDATHVDLQGSTFTSNPATKGTMIPRGGSSKSDAWKTITSGATSTRVAAGDTIRCKKSPDPTSVGSATWTSTTRQGGGLTVLGSGVAITSSTNATPIVLTLSGANYTSLGAGVGDTIYITGHTTNTKANGCWKVSATNGSSTLTLVNADGTNSVGNGAGGASGNIYKVTSTVVTLAAAVTKSIACVGNQGVKGNWTASSNVTCTVTTSDFKEGGECQDIAVGATFTTGLAAFFATGTLDLSTYQQVSFWVKQTSGTVAVTGDAKLQLCTDVAGVTAVHDVAIPALGALNCWTPVTVNLGANLNAAIKSINLTINVDRGAQTFRIDNVIACKAASSADALTLQSLIGKNAAGETFYPIQSINDVRVVLDDAFTSSTIVGAIGTNGASKRGYYGVTETVTTYKRECFRGVNRAGEYVVQQSGSAGSLVAFEGGWDATSMISQDGETWFDGWGAESGTVNLGLNGTTKNYVSVNKFGFVRFGAGLSVVTDGALGWSLDNLHCNGNVSGISYKGQNGTLGTVYACMNNGTGVTWDSGTATSPVVCNTSTSITAHSNAGAGFDLGSATLALVAYNTFDTLKLSNNGGPGYQGLKSGGNRISLLETHYNLTSGTVLGPFGRNTIKTLNTTNNSSTVAASQSFTGFGVVFRDGSNNNLILGGSSSGNRSGSIGVNWVLSADFGTTGVNYIPTANYFRNWTAAEATVVSAPAALRDTRVHIEKLNGVTNDHRIYTDGGTILTDTSVRHTASGVSWKFSPTSANRQQLFPLDLPLAQIAVAANSLVTVKCWIQRDSTSITANLVCRGGQLSGVASDVSVAASGSANTWQEETITFTPTEAGVVEIHGEAYGGTTNNAYFDDFSVTQA